MLRYVKNEWLVWFLFITQEQKQISLLLLCGKTNKIILATVVIVVLSFTESSLHTKRKTLFYVSSYRELKSNRCVSLVKWIKKKKKKSRHIVKVSVLIWAGSGRLARISGAHATLNLANLLFNVLLSIDYCCRCCDCLDSKLFLSKDQIFSNDSFVKLWQLVFSIYFIFFF